MKTSNEIIQRSEAVNSGLRIVYQVYGMDNEGANFAYKNEEYDNYREANESYEEIELDEGFQKSLRLIIVDEDSIVADEFLKEDSL